MAWNLGIDWGVHNLFTCQGFKVNNAANMGIASFDIGGPCSMGKLGLVLLFFIFAIIRKWGGEEIGMSYSLLWSSIIGMGAYFLIITFMGSFKLAMLGGLIIGIAAGYGAGFITGEGEDSSSGGYS